MAALGTGLLYGFHPVAARLRAAPESVEILYLDAARNDARMRDLERQALEKNVRVARVDSARLDGLAGGEARHQGVVAKAAAWAPKWGSLDDRLDEVGTFVRRSVTTRLAIANPKYAGR